MSAGLDQRAFRLYGLCSGGAALAYASIGWFKLHPDAVQIITTAAPFLFILPAFIIENRPGRLWWRVSFPFAVGVGTGAILLKAATGLDLSAGMAVMAGIASAGFLGAWILARHR
ncbi:MAG TPA: hypothetical protein VD886_06055 [Herpetosiphonaceae bacterium]|nr:hypothetical protein [Herpetosiphonaceae bacterium]